MAKMIPFRKKALNLSAPSSTIAFVDLEEARRRLGTVPDQHNAASEQASSWLGGRKPS